jgi:hypothetical protein
LSRIVLTTPPIPPIFPIFEIKTTPLKSLRILLPLCLFFIVGQAQTPYWQQQVTYNITVSLNDSTNELDGWVQMVYQNNSPDTLRYIWFHLWPNGYKNDRTAYTDQSLEQGDTRFYFSAPAQRGYINRLDFRVNGAPTALRDHPRHQDIAQLLLAEPLPPGGSLRISTPFHVQLPERFSRTGYLGDAFCISDWYPQPAVYDAKGWRPMPYTDRGDLYAEWGDYTVAISLPKNYIVAATGLLETKSLADAPPSPSTAPTPKMPVKKSTAFLPGKPKPNPFPPSDRQQQTWVFKATHVPGFAWVADKRWVMKSDQVVLPSGRTIVLQAYTIKEQPAEAGAALTCLKSCFDKLPASLGDYPYPVYTVVETGQDKTGEKVFPGLVCMERINGSAPVSQQLSTTLTRQWFAQTRGGNLQQQPWLGNGLSRYYQHRYQPIPAQSIPHGLAKKWPGDWDRLLLATVTALRKDQPIATPADSLTHFNYPLITSTKAAQWLQQLADTLGQPVFDSAMTRFFQEWTGKHPYPDNLRAVLEKVSGKNLQSHFERLTQPGSPEPVVKRKLKLTGFFNLRETDRYQYISIAPAAGYNFYDKLMPGILVHNYSLPLPRLRFLAAPLYSPTSKNWGGIATLNYTLLQGHRGQQWEIGINGARFTADSFVDSTNTTNFQGIDKLVPTLRFTFAKPHAKSTLTRYLQWKTFFINETGLRFTRDTIRQIDIITYPRRSRYLNQLSFGMEERRALYPWDLLLVAEQGEGFVRTSLTGNYFFNYAKGGGLNLRFFAGKFFYTGDNTFIERFATERYHLNMTGPKGDEDYTYSNYFYGRNEFDRAPSQQIMIRDGAFKVRTDLLSSKVGKTDNWLTAINLTSTLPKAINPLSILPFDIPLQVFVDIGTYADAWEKDAPTSRVLYDAGLQLSLFRNTVTVYMPLLYSKVYKEYFQSVITEKRFVRNLSFSIDFQRFRSDKLTPQFFY